MLCLLSIQLTRLLGPQAMPSHSITINWSNICLAPKHKCPKAATNRRTSQFTLSLSLPTTSIDSPLSLFLQLPASGYFKAQPEPNWRPVSRDLLSDSLRFVADGKTESYMFRWYISSIYIARYIVPLHSVCTYNNYFIITVWQARRRPD